MDVEFHERLQQVLSARGWTAYEWAQRAALSDAAVANMITRKAQGARPASLSALATSAGVNFDWLTRGVGPSGLDEAPPSAPSPTAITATDRPPLTLEDALDRAFDRGAHSLHDALAVRMAFGNTPPVQGLDDTVAAARAWLDAAADLRRSGREVTVVALLERVTVRLNHTIAEHGAAHANAAPASLPTPSASERPVEGTEAMPSESPPPQEGGSGLRQPFQVHRDEHGNLTVTGGNPIAPVTSATKTAKTAGEHKRRH